MNRLNTFEWILITPWMLVNAREHLWMIVNSPWTIIEWAWISLSECEHPIVCMTTIELLLKVTHRGVTMRKIALVWELNNPGMQLGARECLWVSIKCPLNTVECTWMPLSECWTPPECYWVHMNACEWVLNTPWTPIECAWLLLSKYFKGLNEHL